MIDQPYENAITSSRCCRQLEFLYGLHHRRRVFLIEPVPSTTKKAVMIHCIIRKCILYNSRWKLRNKLRLLNSCARDYRLGLRFTTAFQITNLLLRHVRGSNSKDCLVSFIIYIYTDSVVYLMNTSNNYYNLLARSGKLVDNNPQIFQIRCHLDGSHCVSNKTRRGFICFLLFIYIKAAALGDCISVCSSI